MCLPSNFHDGPDLTESTRIKGKRCCQPVPTGAAGSYHAGRAELCFAVPASNQQVHQDLLGALLGYLRTQICRSRAQSARWAEYRVNLTAESSKALEVRCMLHE